MSLKGHGSYVIASEDSKVEGQKLQRDDTQDALQAVDTVRHFDGTAGVLDGLIIIFIADYYGTALKKKKKYIGQRVLLFNTIDFHTFRSHICCRLVTVMKSHSTEASLLFIGVKDQRCGTEDCVI